jgi:hypothetical protein
LLFFLRGNVRGGEIMKKKILTIFTFILILSMTLTTFALARPWNPKNNDKFLDFDVVIGFEWNNLIAAVANPVYVPNADSPNKVIVSWVEEPTTDYTITIEGMGTYRCGTDFDYSGVATLTAIGAPFTPGILGLPQGTKQGKFRVDYMYDFSAYSSGIEGTLEMLAVTAEDGVMWISSQSGSGDLQNVKIFATSVTGGHDGLVIGWPDIPPT